MAELEPLNLHDVPAVTRLNINDLLYQSPLDSEAADNLSDAVDRADDLAGEILDVLEEVKDIADGINRAMSLSEFKSIEGNLDHLCDLRDAVRTQLAVAEDVLRQLETLLGEDESENGAEILQEVTVSVGDINDLHDVAESNIVAISNFIDQ